MYCLVVLKAGSPKSGVSKVCPLGCTGRTPLSFPALAFAGNPWYCLACGCLTPVTWSPSPCLRIIFPRCMSAPVSTFPPFYGDTVMLD